MEVAYAFQDFSSVPDFYQIPAERTKPFGTVHALLCAADVVHEPFCVINADDYYGIDAYRTIYEELVKLPEAGKATMVGYLLKNTASLHGTVSRGVCQVEDGKLRSIREALKVQLYPDGTLKDLDGGRGPVSGDGGVHELLGLLPPASSRPCGTTSRTSSAPRPETTSRRSACCR